MEWVEGEYIISDDPGRVDLVATHELLDDTYWASGRSVEVVKRSIENSVCFGLYCADKQIGFARIVTDRATFAWICDIVIDEKYRGQGLGKWLAKCVVNYPAIKGHLQILGTKDAHTLYERFGFERGELLRRKR